MVFLMRHKAPPQGMPATGGNVPIDLIQKYASQGMTEPEIFSTLQNQGFSPPAIDRAMNMALKSQVTGGSMPQTPSMEIGGPMPPPIEEFPQMYRQQGQERTEFALAQPSQMVMPTRRPMQGQQMQGPPMPRQAMQGMREGYPPEMIRQPSREPMYVPSSPQEFAFEERPEQVEVPNAGEITLEEVIEGIVTDKWVEFESRLSNFEKKDLQLENQIEDIRKKVDEEDKKLKERERDLIDRFEGLAVL